MSTTTTTTSTTTTTTAAPTTDIRYITVRIKRSAVPNKIPTVDDLELGELALNTYDGKLYTLKSTGPVKTVVHLSEGKTYTAGDGIEIDGTTINNTGVTYISGGDNISVTENTGNVVVSFDGVLGIDQGGTGETTANAAFNALAPTQTSHAGKFLRTDGSDTEWEEITATFLTDTLGFTPVNRAGDTMQGNLNFAETHRITNLPEPELGNQPATKNYVDNAITGLHWKPSVAVFADSHVNLSVGPWTIDGYTISTNERILLTNQTADAQNGIWVLNSDSTFSRPVDANSFEKLNAAAVFVQHGTTYGDTGWVQVTQLTSFAGQEWDQFTGGGSLSAGEGISIIGNVISNTGVQRVTAGTGISLTGETGEVDISLDGPVSIENGGTGETTANDAINALLPTQTGKSGGILTTDGIDVRWLQLASEEYASANTYHVSKTGDDITGDGTTLRPFRTVRRAVDLAGIATINDPIVIRIGSGRYIEDGDVLFRPWVFFVGEHHQDVRITADAFGLHEDFEGTDDLRSGAINLTLDGPSHFDFATIDSDAGKLFFESVNFNSAYEVTSNSTVNQIFVENGWMFSTVVLQGGTHNFNGTYFFSNCFISQAATTDGNCIFTNVSLQSVSLDISDFALGTITAFFISSPIQGSLYVDGSYGAVHATSNSLPPKDDITFIASIANPPASLVRLNDAFGTLYDPTTPQDWLDLGATLYNTVGDLIFDVSSALDASVKYTAQNSANWTEVGHTTPTTNKDAIDILVAENYERWKNLRTVTQISSNITLPATVTSPSPSYNPDESTSVILADASVASITVTLPNAADWEKKFYTIKKIDDTPNLVTLQAVSGQKIDGDTSFILSGQNNQITIISDGSNWYELSSTASSGYTGSRGVPGYTGSQGEQGAKGDIGYTGSQGPEGPPGPPTGYTGSRGEQGAIGYTGSQGIPGPPSGYTGSQGEQGPMGFTGYTGSQGVEGPIGPPGPQGPAGGYTGSRGETGYTGSQGEQGPAGGYTGSRGEIGYTGSQGIPGVDGVSAGTTFKYEYRNLTSSAAGLGEVNFNSVSLSSATVIRLHYTDARFVNNKDFFTNITSGSSTIRAYLIFTKESDPSTFAIYSILAAATDDVTNSNISYTISFVSGSSSIIYSDSDPVLISFVRTGDRGDTGYVGSVGPIGYTGSRGESGLVGGSTFPYQYDTSVFSDATPGIVRFTSVNFTTAGIMRLHDIDRDGNDNYGFYTFISTISNTNKAFVTLLDRSDSTNFVIFRVTGMTYVGPGGYYQYDVQYVTGVTSFTQGTLVEVNFVPFGDAGATGYTGSSGTNGYTGSRGEIGYTGSSSTTLTTTNDTTTASLYPVMVAATGSGQSPKINTSDFSFDASTGKLTLKTLKITGALNIQEAFEVVSVVPSGISEANSYYANTQSIVYFTGDSTGNWTMNFVGDGSTSLNSIMETGQSLTLTLLVTHGATGHYETATSVDGTPITVKWLNGISPATATPNTISAYTYSIVKTASNTFTVFGSIARFG
jgi:hypothetical protein